MAPFQPIEPYENGLLDVGDGHQIYWECCGNPTGKPALFLHGGPGTGCSIGQRRFFDPNVYKAVLFDQRGSGRSLPLASQLNPNLASNTTSHLIADIERLRDLLGIESWIILGLSWGTTLGLAYAHAYPRRVKAMVLGFVTTTSRAEVQWITKDVGRIFPKEWERFSEAVPQHLRNIHSSMLTRSCLLTPTRPFAIERRRHGASGRMRTSRSHRDISQIPYLTTRNFDYDLLGWSLTIGATPHF